MAGNASVSANQLVRSTAELEQLNQRIDQLSAKLASEREERASLTAGLDRIDARLSTLSKSIGDSRRKRDRLQVTLKELEREQTRLVSMQQDATARLGDLLRSGYMLGKQSGLRMLVNQEDPHSAARRMAMFRYVIAARNTQLASIAVLANKVERNRIEADSSAAALEQTLADLARDEEQIKADRKERELEVEQLKKVLARGESRLNLYRERQDGLERLLVELRRPPKPAVNRPPKRNVVAGQLKPAPVAAGARVISSQPVDTEVARKNSGASSLPSSTPVTPARTRAQTKAQTTAQTERVPEPAEDHEIRVLAGFANNRGKLTGPLKARIEARFGDRRPDGGLSWQGVLYGASNGQPVRAVYPGQVVFSDWFRGYGQLMVVDHGDGYMSLYGHNQALDARVGESVEAGEVIARANDASEVPVPGLYFEIRHNGAPDDPLQWIR